jgi:chemotaxis protein MotB
VKLLTMLAGQVDALPNHLLIEGHTDSQPYSSDNGYTNWELSSDRANSARRVLQQGGVGASQIAQVRGYADQFLRVPTNPLDPSNRRISLIVEWVDAPAAPPGTEEAGKETKDGPAKPDGAEGVKETKSSAADVKPAAGSAGDSAAAKPVVAAGATPAQPAVATKPTAAIPVAKPSMMERMKALMPGKKK